MPNKGAAENIGDANTIPTKSTRELRDVALNDARNSVIQALLPNTPSNTPTSELSIEEYLAIIKLNEQATQEPPEIGHRSDAIAAEIMAKYDLGIDFLPTELLLPTSEPTEMSGPLESEPASGIRKKQAR